MFRVALLTACAASLVACAPPTATVSDFNGASVKIQVPELTNEPEVARANADAEAARICALGGNRKRAEYVSRTYNPNTYIYELLYLCLA